MIIIDMIDILVIMVIMVLMGIVDIARYSGRDKTVINSTSFDG